MSDTLGNSPAMFAAMIALSLGGLPVPAVDPNLYNSAYAPGGAPAGFVSFRNQPRFERILAGSEFLLLDFSRPGLVRALDLPAFDVQVGSHTLSVPATPGLGLSYTDLVEDPFDIDTVVKTSYFQFQYEPEFHAPENADALRLSWAADILDDGLLRVEILNPAAFAEAGIGLAGTSYVFSALPTGTGRIGGAFVPVPEPAAWAMWAAGLALAGMALRRRSIA